MDNGSLRKALAVLGLILALFVMLPEKSHATVMLIGSNKSFSFDDLEANFVLPTKGSGLCGMLQVAEPLDACSPLRNKAVSGEGLDSPFALIQRGTCSFQTKVRHAQDAGFKAAIVYNNEDKNDLITMDGNSRGITIMRMLSQSMVMWLLGSAGNTNMECWIIPTQNTSWTVCKAFLTSLIVYGALLASVLL
ncbi:hypothetical protein KI387_025358 [Taxus chinensis]|uniref:PA domain-containing protein n=1 Tax=Taxus chinensis TaxID=29808 RepID=A0AA38LAF5_TAXCH|nr:hypothetical protein KI387_025358 [Taxus chinensis]